MESSQFTTQPTNQPNADKQPGDQKIHWSYWVGTVQSLVIALLIVIPIRLFVAQPFIVSGDSMNHTFANGQYLIIDKLTHRFESPERGEVIIFRYPKDTSKFFIKRVIGLPGETVITSSDKVTIKNKENLDGFVLDEPYLSNVKTRNNLTKKLNDQEYFVMGDNRDRSHDSRTWGALSEMYITGRVILRLLPINQIDLLPGALAKETL